MLKMQSKRKFEFKMRNPYETTKEITQEVILSNSLQYDYSKSDWLAIDAEFLGLDQYRDSLCTVQIASADPDYKNRQRVEIISVYNQKIDKKLQMLLQSNKLKLFHVFASDMVMLNRFLETTVHGPVFDTKVATKIVWTNARTPAKTEFIRTFIDPKYEAIHFANARWEIEIKKWSEKMAKYAALDVLYLHSMMAKLQEIAKDRNRKEVLDHAMKAIPYLSTVFTAGFDLEIFKF